jgi:hypothetical protein
MGQKKSSTSRKQSATTANKKSHAESRKELAQLIYAVLTHPAIPAKLYNDFSAAFMDFQSTCIDYTAMLDSAEVIEKTLAMFDEKGGIR